MDVPFALPSYTGHARDGDGSRRTALGARQRTRCISSRNSSGPRKPITRGWARISPCEETKATVGRPSIPKALVHRRVGRTSTSALVAVHLEFGRSAAPRLPPAGATAGGSVQLLAGRTTPGREIDRRRLTRGPPPAASARSTGEPPPALRPRSIPGAGPCPRHAARPAVPARRRSGRTEGGATAGSLAELPGADRCRSFSEWRRGGCRPQPAGRPAPSGDAARAMAVAWSASRTGKASLTYVAASATSRTPEALPLHPRRPVGSCTANAPMRKKGTPMPMA